MALSQKRAEIQKSMLVDVFFKRVELAILKELLEYGFGYATHHLVIHKA